MEPSLAGDPGVTQRLLCRQPAAAVLLQQLPDEVLGLAGDPGPLLLGEGNVALPDVGEEDVLAQVAGLALVPAAVVLAPRLEVWKGAYLQSRM